MPVSLYKGYSETNGFGAFTPQPIKKGDIIAVWDGPYAEKLPESELARYYLYVRPNKWLIGFGGEYPESFINHSCDPNTKITWDGDIATLTSIRSIQSNEEITFDYETVIPSDHGFIFNCSCGATACRKVIRVPTCSL